MRHALVPSAIAKRKVKPADTPDSVHGGCPPRDRHSSGPTVACRLGAAYPPAERAASSLAYLALLRAEIARFTRTEPARFCCSDPHLAVERCYLLRCPVQSGRSSDAVFPRLRQRRSGRLYAAHCRAISAIAQDQCMVQSMHERLYSPGPPVLSRSRAEVRLVRAGAPSLFDQGIKPPVQPMHQRLDKSSGLKTLPSA